MGGCEDVGEISGSILLPPQLPFLLRSFVSNSSLEISG